MYHRDVDTKHGGGGSSMDDSRVGTVISNSDVLETRGKSALELATSSRYVVRPVRCWLITFLLSYVNVGGTYVYVQPAVENSFQHDCPM